MYESNEKGRLSGKSPYLINVAYSFRECTDLLTPISGLRPSFLDNDLPGRERMAL